MKILNSQSIDTRCLELDNYSFIGLPLRTLLACYYVD